jgi:hypothetical protein
LHLVTELKGKTTMSRYVWGNPGTAKFTLATREDAPDALDTSPGEVADDTVTEPFALYLGVEGEGLIVEGDLYELVDWADRVHAHVHKIAKAHA